MGGVKTLSVVRHLYTDEELTRMFAALTDPQRPLPRHSGISAGQAYTRDEMPGRAYDKFVARHGVAPEYWAVLGVSDTASVYVLGPIPNWPRKRRR